jgi:hypothetical protein
MEHMSKILVTQSQKRGTLLELDIDGTKADLTENIPAHGLFKHGSATSNSADDG